MQALFESAQHFILQALVESAQHLEKGKIWEAQKHADPDPRHWSILLLGLRDGKLVPCVCLHNTILQEVLIAQQERRGSKLVP